MKSKLSIINFILLVCILIFLGYNHFNNDTPRFKEIKAERLSIVDENDSLYISISNPERQALATTHGVPHYPNSKRDLPGLIFFNRVGDEVGGIYYDGTDEENYAGITFDQQKNDQIMAIMKDEYLDEGEWKRWYGIFFRERSDSVRVRTLFEEFNKRTENLLKEEKRKEYLNFKKYLDEEINVYRMFLGRMEKKHTGLFIYDSKGKERIKIYVDEDDNAKIQILDKEGSEVKFNQ